jgi:cytosine/adenosine deaminase-related metal-dependent hydrolase
LRLATIGGAQCLGRESELGSLEPGKLADVAVWRLDGLGLAGGVDPVFCWAFSSSAPLELLLVNGRGVVAEGTLLTADSGRLAREAAAASARVASR